MNQHRHPAIQTDNEPLKSSFSDHTGARRPDGAKKQQKSVNDV